MEAAPGLPAPDFQVTTQNNLFIKISENIKIILYYHTENPRMISTLIKIIFFLTWKSRAGRPGAASKVSKIIFS